MLTRRATVPYKPLAPVHIIIFALLSLGVVLGGIFATGFYWDEYLISQNIYASFRNLDIRAYQALNFRNSVFRHFRTVSLIWILGFLHAGIFFQVMIIGVRGFFIGYGVSMLVIQFGASGLLLAIPAIILQNIFFIIVLFFIVINFRVHEKKLHDRIVALFIALICAVISSLYESYISPSLCLWIFESIS